MLPTEIFIAHSNSDYTVADTIVAELRRHNLSVWYSRTNILGAQQWHDEIGFALDRCDWMLVLLSRASVQSKWVKFEYTAALNESRFDRHIVPVLLEPCNPKLLSFTLPSLQSIDFQQSREEGIKKILQLWNINYIPPPPAP